MVSGLWSSDHDIQGTLYQGDICELARSNEEKRRKLVAKISMMIPQVESMSIKLIEVAKKYLAKLGSQKLGCFLSPNSLIIHQLDSISDKIAADLSELEKDQASKLSNFKKSIKSNA